MCQGGHGSICEGDRACVRVATGAYVKEIGRVSGSICEGDGVYVREHM